MRKLWVDQHRPKRIKELDYHQKLSEKLYQIAKTTDFPVIYSHQPMVFYGPSGSGKKTRILSFLAEIFSQSVHRLKSESKIIKHNNTKLQFTLNQSNHHIQITPSDADFHDRLIVSQVINQNASYDSVNNKEKGFKVLVINEADRLSRQAQACLRRTLQKFSSKCKMILCCKDLSKLIDPLKSRCLLMRVPSPQQSQITNILLKILSHQHLQASQDVIYSISMMADGNVRSAIIQLQTQMIRGNLLNNKRSVNIQWKIIVDKIVEDLTGAPGIQKMPNIRDSLYNLLVNLFPGPVIIKQMLKKLITIAKTDKCRIKLIQTAARCQHMMVLGTKPIIHLQNFCASAMLYIKQEQFQ